MSDTVTSPAEQDTISPESEIAAKKKGLPWWVTVLVVAICLGVVYGIYTNMTAEKQTVIIKKGKG